VILCDLNVLLYAVRRAVRTRLDDGRAGTIGAILAWPTEIKLDDGERLVVLS
jgi:hypothetical protein